MEVESEYERASECEDYEDYCIDGYYPVALGERFNQKYRVIQKLGWGQFSTVWLVAKESTGEYCALKIQKSKQSYFESAVEQLSLLSKIVLHESKPDWQQFLVNFCERHAEAIYAPLCRPLVLLDNFIEHGIHGKHCCLVFEILGPNLLDVIQHFEFKDARMPLWLVRKITRDVLIGLVFLHDFCNVIHTDIKPENIMVKLAAEEEATLVKQVSEYKIKPISEKYLKMLKKTTNSKNKRKKDRKKAKANKNAEQNDADLPSQTPPQQSVQSLPKSIDDSSQPSKQYSIEANNSTFNHSLSVNQDSSIAHSSASVSQTAVESPHTSLDSAPFIDQQADQKPHINTQEINREPEKCQIAAKQANPDSPSKQAVGKAVDMDTLKWKNLEIDLKSKNLFYKIVDLGNACPETEHYSSEIQTREYRSPEVLLEQDYQKNTDVWSVACVVFQMLTNNFLFKPVSSENISKSEDHLYKILRVLGLMEKEFALQGQKSSYYFSKKGRLLKGEPKDRTSIASLLFSEYGYSPEESCQIEEFLLPMLAYEPNKRVSAMKSLEHPWLWK